ncbi:septation ring formation regulator EzrA [Salsuginibacillus kocurii]|uniref:septation ring formation regulator EzrA n=1 Tax=Salsuginibacillus kocurii TaxID=427078 RepID=UPI00035DE5ED|nr:septation ring formation regulator EzrA [Salsuginibacillus kocurii]
MEYIIILALLLGAFIGYGAFARRKVYRLVDELEAKKMDISQRAVAEEIGKVKGLKVSGETEEKFEQWRRMWDHIVEDELPEFEEDLYDIEEWANKYRFKKARKHAEETKVKLERIENNIDQIFTEVNELVNSEEKNRLEIEEIRAKYEHLNREVSMNWRSLGRATSLIEEELKNVKVLLQTFDDEMSEGNYIRAREILKEMEEQLEKQANYVSLIPAQLVEIEVELPKQLKELRAGMAEMEEQDYPLEHLELPTRFNRVEHSLKEVGTIIEELKVEEAAELIETVQADVEKTYQELEQEVEAREYVENKAQYLNERLETLQEALKQLQQERAKVEQSYRLEATEQSRQDEVGKELDEATKEWRVALDKLEHNKQAYSFLENHVQDLEERLDQSEEKIEASREQMKTLRKDELIAIDTMKSLRQQLRESEQKLKKSRLPKVPSHLIESFQEAAEKLNQSSSQLKEVPLEMSSVNATLEQANQQVKRATQHLEVTLTQAERAERLIQYGNRYRSRDNELNQVLHEAEEQFRNGSYDEAIQIARSPLEKRVPHVISEIEKSLEEKAE